MIEEQIVEFTPISDTPSYTFCGEHPAILCWFHKVGSSIEVYGSSYYIKGYYIAGNVLYVKSQNGPVPLSLPIEISKIRDMATTYLIRTSHTENYMLDIAYDAKSINPEGYYRYSLVGTIEDIRGILGLLTEVGIQSAKRELLRYVL